MVAHKKLNWCIKIVHSWNTIVVHMRRMNERNGTNERNPKSRAIQPNARGWELIINIVFGIMPQTIQSKCFIFWYALSPSQRTQCKNDSNISTFYICIYSNWNIFLLITIFAIKFFCLAPSLPLCCTEFRCKQIRNMRNALSNSIKVFTDFSIHFDVFPSFLFFLGWNSIEMKTLKQSFTNLKLPFHFRANF